MVNVLVTHGDDSLPNGKEPGSIWSTMVANGLRPGSNTFIF